MSSEGSREIEGAKKRFAAANSQATAAATNLESAKQMLASAQSMSDAAEKERKEAKAALSAAEKRWEVINIDEDDIRSPTNNSGSSIIRRRNVSLSPHQGTNYNPRALEGPDHVGALDIMSTKETIGGEYRHHSGKTHAELVYHYTRCKFHFIHKTKLFAMRYSSLSTLL